MKSSVSLLLVFGEVIWCVCDWFILVRSYLCSAVISHSLFNSHAEDSSYSSQVIPLPVTHARAPYETMFSPPKFARVVSRGARFIVSLGTIHAQT